ncbi:MFS transporter [Acidocella sp.]|uniref:MFS transporter n=1 Tax=Acidocella sp. TaxID=50710 RepID=UPI002617B58B|nr:MFS transporter [Acidocella sp.]
MRNADPPVSAPVLLLAIACGVLVANIYDAQPLIALIGPDIALGPRGMGLIVSLTQVGYAVGLVGLVPLADLFETRRLVLATVTVSLPALLLAAAARSGPVMLIASLLIGLTSVSVQMLVPIAARLTPLHKRGQVVGTVMSGLLFGILLARPAAALIAGWLGWRAVFLVSFAVTSAMALALRATLPPCPPESRLGYGALVASMLALPFRLPMLRVRMLIQAVSFFGVSVFWTQAPVYLHNVFGFSSFGISGFALAGAAGALVAPLAGRLADFGYGRQATWAGLLCIAGGFVLGWLGGQWHSLALLVAAAIAVDGGVQFNLPVGQRAIYTEAPELRARLTGLFIASFFAAGAAGTALSGPAMALFGWGGLCLACAVLALLVLAAILIRGAYAPGMAPA